MKFLPIFFYLFYFVNGKIDGNQVKCLVCQESLNQIKKAVSEIDPNLKIDIGGYGIDTEGNYRHKTISQSKSEVHLSEMLENICKTLDDYARATWKSNGTLTLIKLIGDDGNMNKLTSEIDFVQDDDLNKSLRYHCENLVEEYEDDIIESIQNEISDINEFICREKTNLCPLKYRNEL